MQFKWNRATLIIIFWILFLIVDSLKKMRSFIGNSDILLFYHLPGYVIWVILTFPLNFLFDWSGKLQLWKRALFLVGTGIVIGAIKVWSSWLLYYVGFVFIKGNPAERNVVEYLLDIGLFYFMEAFIISWVILFVFFVIEIYNKYKEQTIRNAALETQLAKAQLQTLKMQLRPHFLFNANHVITMLIRKGENNKAVEMISGLSDLLRMSLERETNQMITLKEELELIKKYLYIEAVRFEDRLMVDYTIPENVKSALVPNFVLQPLVENAFKHGISKTIGKASLKIVASKKQDKLTISIFNTGPRVVNNQPADNGTQIGISNTRKRLQQLYKDDCQLDLINKEHGVEAVITIPFQIAEN